MTDIKVSLVQLPPVIKSVTLDLPEGKYKQMSVVPNARSLLPSPRSNGRPPRNASVDYEQTCTYTRAHISREQKR